MTKPARLPERGHVPVVDGATAQATPGFQRHYYAFLSYSHKDSATADWLHRALERFRVPHALAGRVTADGVIPKRLIPVFRDRHELAAGHDLGTEIRAALTASQYLVVLCSPAAAQSHWTNAEIDTFKRSRPDGCVFAAIIDGEPFASEMPGREAEECFPPALREQYDRRGRPTARRAEPLAADFRESGDGKRLAFLKLVAGMLGVGLDELAQRETTRRHRQLAWLAAASLAGMAVTSTLAVAAVQARDAARDQRREAEGLISFMLGDLKDKLEPIGRLDALDGVGGRVLAYYQKQDASTLPDSSLMQRSSALSLMASVANSRGDLDGAMRLYREAMAGTLEAIQRKPNDPQRIFDHAQNVFYVGDIALRRGDSKAAEAAFRDYKTLSEREVALDPNNMKWRMEAQSADANLGVMLYNQRRYAEASRQFEPALHAIEAMAAADPRNVDYQKSLAESLAWVADSHLAEGRLDLAVADRERDVRLLEKLLGQTRDSEFTWKLVAAQRVLAYLYMYQGRINEAIDQVRTATAHSDQLLAVEPTNSKWVERATAARLDLADDLLLASKTAEASAMVRSACDLAQSLYSRGSEVSEWSVLHRLCLRVRAEVAFASGDKVAARQLASQAVAAAKLVHSDDPITDQFAAARAYRLLGDIELAMGRAAEAKVAWTSGLALIPARLPEDPDEMNQHQLLLQRLGRKEEANRLARRLAAIGFRQQRSIAT